MDDEFIGEHGIRLDLVARTSSNEILNIVLRKQVVSTETTMQKKNDVLREQIVADQTDVDVNGFVDNC